MLALTWTFRLVEDPDRPFPDWARRGRAPQPEADHGRDARNVNLVILFLCVAALYAYQNRFELGAGALLGLAIVCKVTPALLVYCIRLETGMEDARRLRRRHASLLSLAAGRRFRSLTKRRVARQLGQSDGEAIPERRNRLLGVFQPSLPGLVSRLFTDSPSDTTWVEHREQVPTSFHNVASLSRGAVKAIMPGCMGLFAALVMLVCRTPTDHGAAGVSRRRRASSCWACCFSANAPGNITASPSASRWRCSATASPGKKAGAAWGIAVVLGLTLMLMTSTSTLGLGEGIDDLGRLSQVYGAYVWAYVVLVLALARIVAWSRGGCECQASTWLALPYRPHS